MAHSEFEKNVKMNILDTFIIYNTILLDVYCYALYHIIPSFFLFFIQCCPVLGYSLGSCAKQTIKCIRRPKVVQCETAELGEQYTLYHKKAEEFISLFVALKLKLGSSLGLLLKCHLVHIYATCNISIYSNDFNFTNSLQFKQRFV